MCVGNVSHLNLSDTCIYIGKYNDKDCIIKRIELDYKIGIKSKVIREISFLKKIRHKNIVKLYNVLYDDDFIYIVLEKGLEDVYSMPHNDIKQYNILDDVLIALKHIEEKKYIHGDLNFENIVMFKKTETQKIFKLIDFGSTTKIYRKSAIRTPTYYISPIEILECFKKKISIRDNTNIDPEKIDSWAYGCLSYYVTTGNIIINSNIYNTIEEINYANTDIKYLLSSDVKSRYTIKQYYEKKKLKNVSNKKKNNVNKLDEKVNKYSDKTRTLFCKKKMQLSKLKIKNELFKDFLILDVFNNISVENIFITFKLIEKIKYDEDDQYIIFCYILFCVSTKLISVIEFSLDEIIKIINLKLKNANNKILSLIHFNNLTFNILSQLNWNIDVDTHFSMSFDCFGKCNTKYLIIALILNYNINDTTVCSEKKLHNYILTLLELLNTENNELLIDNKIMIKYLIKSLEKIKLNEEFYDCLKLFTEKINEKNYLESILKL